MKFVIDIHLHDRLPTTDGTSETTVQNLYRSVSLYSRFHASFLCPIIKKAEALNCHISRVVGRLDILYDLKNDITKLS